MKSKLPCILLAITFVLSFYKVTVGDSIKIVNYSFREGLTTSGVNSVFKDSKGFLWICASNGLFRYDGHSFKNINSLANGLLKLETYCIIEDTNHNFLIGTAGKGVAYYNSHTGKLFGLKLSEGSNSKVNRILIHQGKVWIATNAGLIAIDENQEFDPESTVKTHVLWPDPVHKNFQMNVINFIYAKPGSQSLWVGTNSSLYELDLFTYQFKRIDSKNQNSIRWLSDFKDENIIASSWDGGVFSVNVESQKLSNDPFIDEVNKIVGNKRVKSATIDDQGRCWIATFGEGLYVFSKEKDGKTRHDNYRNDEDLTLRLKSNFLDQICIDSSGIAWISMADGGLSKVYFEKNIFQYHSFPESNGPNKFKEILGINQSTDKDKIWVTFNRNEIDLYDTKTYERRQFTSKSTGLQLHNDKVTLTYQDSKGNLWIVYSRIGLYVVPSVYAKNLINGTEPVSIIPLDANILFAIDPRANSYITCFFEDSKGRLWIGSWGSTHVLERNDDFGSSVSFSQLKSNTKVRLIYSEERKEEAGFTISPVNSILDIGDNKYWLGTRDGGIIMLNEISDLNFIGKDLELNDKLPSSNIKCFYLDKNRILWIGTNSGLCYLETDKFTEINTITGLSSESINSIMEDEDQNIWISTSYGISKINRKDFSITNLFNSDDEKFNQYIGNAVYASTTKELWFTTHEALVSINPNSIENNEISAPIYFTDISVNNHKIVPFEKYRGSYILEDELNAAETINIPYGSTLNIEFAAINYLNPERSFYKYKIGNNDWSVLSPGQRSLILSNMNPGKYTLSIMLADSSAKNSVRTVNINNLPPFWLSKIAYAIYLSIALLLLFTYRRLIIQKILQKSLIEKERFERRKIEELDKMKNEFLSNISHEFRTPLSLIINPLEKLIVQDDISDHNKNRLRLVLKSSNRMLKLTNELMDYSKIEQDKLKPDFHLCEIVSATNEICQLFNNLANTMNIEFKFNHSFDQLEIPVDKGMFEKVIFNLLSNAFKYTPLNGIIMVNISKVFEAHNEYAKISVINTGEGISKENQKMIFDRYFQVNNVQNKNMEGTGIGLALVKSFVELHHGRVELSSDPTLETCFDVCFPVIQEGFSGNGNGNGRSIESVINHHENISSGNHVEKPTAHYRVLVVEDEEDIRNYLIDELSIDYNVLSATNGGEGLKIASKIIPDLIITDVMMPILNGIELSHTLKNQVITSHIPIIILSAKTDMKEQIEGLEMGADVYLIKPFNIDYLKAQILRLINFKQAVYSRFLKDTFPFPQDAVSNRLDKEFMQKVLTFIDENLTNSDLNVDQLAQYVAFSKVQTYRKIKAISGLSIVEFIRSIRLKKAVQLIMEGNLNFSEIAFETGFSTPSYFSKCFHDHFGITPSEYALEYVEKKKIVPTP